jgi:hypothetical protein
MKILRSTLRLLIFVVALCLGSCSKGYQVRFTNYYIETMDSVIIGNNTLVFTNIPLLSQSDYSKIGSGDYKITCVTNNKKKFFSSISIPPSGSGKRTIQIDAIKNFSILED